MMAKILDKKPTDNLIAIDEEENQEMTEEILTIIEKYKNRRKNNEL